MALQIAQTNTHRQKYIYRDIHIYLEDHEKLFKFFFITLSSRDLDDDIKDTSRL